MNKNIKIILLFTLTIIVMCVVTILLINKTKEKESLPVHEDEEQTIIVDISNGFKSRYSVEENDNKILFKDLNYMRNTNLIGYTGTIKKVVITAGCNDDDSFIIIAILTTDGLYGITLDDESYYRKTLDSYELIKISDVNNIDTIYAGSNLDENVNVINENLVCYRYPYIRYSDGTSKAIEPSKCETNYYCAGDLNLINIK